MQLPWDSMTRRNISMLLYEPRSGNVFFAGRDITRLPPYKRQVNTVFQKYALFPHLNVYELSLIHIFCVLSSILATQMPCRSRRSGA